MAQLHILTLYPVLAGVQQASKPCQHGLVSEIPESHVESDAGLHARLPQVHLQRLWERHRAPHQAMGVSFPS